ncbi:hypothetical protein [Haloarcula sp. 1CSR25-25]|uniref:phage terminase large subunit family protein n=1 Tax=Haloarcula sp. 1CSR25-25 TaxID=2862545 RepID=UPI002895E671|nr:hypothetical protein [Haloarcula sp. 1CSR25-25]MDT3434698.1 hypothetical protein [Haloarcula sp. 1CSR25-25]
MRTTTDRQALLGPNGKPPTYTTHPKQEAVLESDARHRTCAWGRRGGKNITAVIDITEYGRAPWRSDWGADDPTTATVWWVGPTYDQAKKHGYDTLKAALPAHWIEKTSRSEPYEIQLTNGVTYEFRTFDKPESLQGAGVDRMVIDEMAYMPRSLWDNDLQPMLMDRLGCALFISKPRGRGLFYEMYQRGESDDFPDHESFHATSADNPFIAEDPTEKRGDVPERVYRQEYLAEFVEESGGVFEHLDETLFTAAYDIDSHDGTAPYRHGWDLARHEDWLVGVVLDADGDIVHFERARGLSWPQIQGRIETAAADYPGTVGIDASRDNKLVADLAAAGLNIVPVRFTLQRKQDLVENLAAAIEAGDLTAPELPQLQHELEIFEYEVTPSGTTKYHAPEGFHDDCVDALAMANAVTARQRSDDGFARSF